MMMEYEMNMMILETQTGVEELGDLPCGFLNGCLLMSASLVISEHRCVSCICAVS
jgi:hypothetical protein